MRIAMAWLVLAATVSGCLSNDMPAESNDAASTLTPATSILLTESCWEAAGRFEIPLDEAQQMVPPGFSVNASGQFEDQAILFVTALQCEVFAESPEATTDVQIHSLILAEPPEELAIQCVKSPVHGVIVDWLTTNAHVAEIYASWGVPFTGATISFELIGDNPATRVARFVGETDQEVWSLDSAARTPTQPYGSGQARAFYEHTVAGVDRLSAVDVTWDGIPNTALAGSVLSHPTFGDLQSLDTFQAWPYDIQFAYFDAESLKS